MHLRIQVWSRALIIIPLLELPTLLLQHQSCYFSPHLDPPPSQNSSGTSLRASTTVVCCSGISVMSRSPCRHRNTPVADGWRPCSTPVRRSFRHFFMLSHNGKATISFVIPKLHDIRSLYLCRFVERRPRMQSQVFDYHG